MSGWESLMSVATQSYNAHAPKTARISSDDAPPNPWQTIIDTYAPKQPSGSGAPDDVRSGILEAAEELGVDPLDLATAISYETAGTFDPTKGGPTTKWGQHRGLIQFGEPQAKQYGVDWNDPVGSQLGREGAVVKYLRDTGVRPGMDLLDIYSAINAGGVGRYSRSDSHAGGAPGTVRDKVQNQMAGHRRNAARLLGEDFLQKSRPTREQSEAALSTTNPVYRGSKIDFSKLWLTPLGDSNG